MAASRSRGSPPTMPSGCAMQRTFRSDPIQVSQWKRQGTDGAMPESLAPTGSDPSQTAVSSHARCRFRTSDILLVRLQVLTQTRCGGCFSGGTIGSAGQIRVKSRQAADLTTPSPPHLLSLRFGCGLPTSRGRSRPDCRAWRVPLWISTKMVISSSDGSGMAALRGVP